MDLDLLGNSHTYGISLKISDLYKLLEYSVKLQYLDKLLEVGFIEEDRYKHLLKFWANDIGIFLDDKILYGH